MARKTVVIDGKTYFIATLHNNPGNVVIGQKFVGENGSYKNDRPQPFASFDSKHAGLRALMRDIRTKISHANAVNTEINYKPGATQSVRYIVSRFAPKSDNNKTEAYIQSIIQAVSKANGIPVTKTKANTVKISNTEYASAGLDDLRVSGKDIMAIVEQKIVHENGGTAFLVNGKYVPAVDYYMKDKEMFKAARRMAEVSLVSTETTSKDLLDVYYNPEATIKKEKKIEGGLPAGEIVNSMDNDPSEIRSSFEKDDLTELEINKINNQSYDEFYKNDKFSPPPLEETIIQDPRFDQTKEE
jgi:hypothetical protein|tara:strand:- start:16 stop:915 length:900 start_codon:yes stop_codon:yes gene_type:complete